MYTVVELARFRVADPQGSTLRWLVRCRLARVDEQRRTLTLHLTEEECQGWTMGDKVQLSFTHVPNGVAS